MTVEQIAEELQVNIETVRRWLRSKELRGTRLSSQAGWRVRREELDRFLRERGDPGAIDEP